MKFTEGAIGRVFVLQFEEGDDITASVEHFAKEHGIATGYINFTGLVNNGSLSAGSGAADSDNLEINGVYEGSALGLLAIDTQGNPLLHINATFGHGSSVLGGYIKEKLTATKNAEAVLYEITGAVCNHTIDASSGRKMLSTSQEPQKKTSAASDRLNVKKISGDHSHIIHFFNSSIN